MKTPHDHRHDHGDHGHDHDHPAGHDPHAPRADHDDTLSYYRRLEIAVRELLCEKGVITPDEVRATVEDLERRGPEGGARVVARAWTDAAFKAKLLADPMGACASLGFDMTLFPVELAVVENTPTVHHAVVCTLCSCYPRMLLGTPPAWYKSRAYRSRMVREPRAVLREFGTEIPDDVEVRVHDSTADLRYLVLPMRPPGTEGLSEEQLAALVTRDAMIGVTVLKSPS